MRAPFSEDLKDLRSSLGTWVQTLNADPNWYGSVYYERKRATRFAVNLKKTDIAERITAGVVFRIYDGTTLFEQATDEVSPDALTRATKNLVKRVKEAAALPSPLPKLPYRAPSWSERLSVKLDPEITSQIPVNPKATDWVHFGIRFERDPLKPTAAERVAALRALLEKSQKLAPQAGLAVSDISFASAQEERAVEEAIFIDQEVNLSQTLYRLNMRLILMSGSERIPTGQGGLGGLECVDLPESRVLTSLRDLAGLKHAQRLKPGRYRVLFSPMMTGVLAHEAFGHSQEGDTCARGRSKAWDLHHSGTTVGNENATILNNPAIYRNGKDSFAAWGSYFFDEEGWLAREQVLLDQGKLKAPMTNLTSSLRLGVPRTANGKREDWSHGVYTRQTNTYFSAGDKTLDELVKMTGDGFLATHSAGGMEDPKGMGIQCGTIFLREVRSGKITDCYFRGPAGGDIQLTGYTPEILGSIVAKSKIDFESTSKSDQDLHPENDVGGCGKYHKEIVYAGSGGPYMLLDNVTLG